MIGHDVSPVEMMSHMKTVLSGVRGQWRRTVVAHPSITNIGYLAQVPQHVNLGALAHKLMAHFDYKFEIGLRWNFIPSLPNTKWVPPDNSKARLEAPLVYTTSTSATKAASGLRKFLSLETPRALQPFGNQLRFVFNYSELVSLDSPLQVRAGPEVLRETRDMRHKQQNFLDLWSVVPINRDLINPHALDDTPRGRISLTHLLFSVLVTPTDTDTQTLDDSPTSPPPADDSSDGSNSSKSIPSSDSNSSASDSDSSPSDPPPAAFRRSTQANDGLTSPASPDSLRRFPMFSAMFPTEFEDRWLLSSPVRVYAMASTAVLDIIPYTIALLGGDALVDRSFLKFWFPKKEVEFALAQYRKGSYWDLDSHSMIRVHGSHLNDVYAMASSAQYNDVEPLMMESAEDDWKTVALAPSTCSLSVDFDGANMLIDEGNTVAPGMVSMDITNLALTAANLEAAKTDLSSKKIELANAMQTQMNLDQNNYELQHQLEAQAAAMKQMQIQLASSQPTPDPTTPSVPAPQRLAPTDVDSALSGPGTSGPGE